MPPKLHDVHERKVKILGVLANASTAKALSVNEIAEACEIHVRFVRPVLNALVDEGIVSRVLGPGRGGRYYYSLTDVVISIPTVFNNRTSTYMDLVSMAQAASQITPSVTHSANFAKIAALKLILAQSHGNNEELGAIREEIVESISVLKNTISVLEQLRDHTLIWERPVGNAPNADLMLLQNRRTSKNFKEVIEGINDDTLIKLAEAYAAYREAYTDLGYFDG